ncbi:hypothetical protein JOQ06_003155 [Pogonophryne albipinna]|uniref:HECT domain-containing protein n=1 Tax=Pogonophryne albipinna TaxID=1090488 RepID=A0AAD6B5R4_9TELE|nr:hypothetical protein JOQ06_003155 [Pogonophryne albipinna]
MTDENENGTQEFNSVMNRVFNALDVARRDLAAQRNDNVLRVTRSTFRRRRRAPTTGASNESAGVWRVKLFLLALADQSVLPAPTDSSRLSRQGLGIPAHDQQGVVSERSYVKLSMTLLELLMIEVQTSMGIFEGKAGQVFLTYDQAALDGHKYFQAGRLIAVVSGTRRSVYQSLDPSLYQLMCGQEPQLEQFDCSVLPDPDVQSRAKRILQCKTAEDLSALQQDLGDWISECVVPGIFSATIGEIPKIYSYVVKHYIFLRTAKMVNQFTEGMNAFGKLWDLVRNNWIAFLHCFTNMRTPLTKSSFKAIFKYEYSPRGTNHREKEEDTIYSWELILNLIEDKLTELTFEDLLIFITGADEVPTLGFPNKPSIDFYTQEVGERRLPYASTCAMTLFLPRGITEEQELHNILNQSVKDSWGFLKV